MSHWFYTIYIPERERERESVCVRGEERECSVCVQKKKRETENIRLTYIAEGI